MIVWRAAPTGHRSAASLPNSFRSSRIRDPASLTVELDFEQIEPAMQIYLSREGERTGPYSVEEVNRQLAAGMIIPSDLGWSESSPGWKPLASFAGVIMPGGASSTATPITIATPLAAPPPRYAGFWIRVLAFTIDLLILIIGSEMIVLLLKLSSGEGSGWLAIAAVLQLLCFIYMPALWSSPMQGTLGQAICSLKVIRAGGAKVSFPRGLIRVFGMVLSGLILGIGYVMVAFSERKQGLHDILAGTYVVKGH